MSQELLSCSCPQCHHPFQVPASLQGRGVTCKGCRTHFTIPTLQATVVAAATATSPAAAVGQGSVPVMAGSSSGSLIHEVSAMPLDEFGGGSDALASHHYHVIRLVTTGKMPHVNVESALNKSNAEGWCLQQVVVVGTDAFAIFHRAE